MANIKLINQKKLLEVGCQKDIDLVVREYFKSRGLVPGKKPREGEGSWWQQIKEKLTFKDISQPYSKVVVNFRIISPKNEEVKICIHGEIFKNRLNENNEKEFLIDKLVFLTDNKSTNLVYNHLLECASVI